MNLKARNERRYLLRSHGGHTRRVARPVVFSRASAAAV
jgi:hypothetical protein